MCGIYVDVTTAPQQAHLDAVLELLRHRGPDAQKAILLPPPGESSGRAAQPSGVVLAHTRLSIIDLREGANQPLYSADGRYVIVYNGEVYNYVELREQLIARGVHFVTTSDSEVILNHFIYHGIERTLAEIEGMYAFCIADTKEGHLTLARDPFGIKPLHWVKHDYGVAFCSEQKPLWRLPGVSKEIDGTVAWEYLRYGITDHSTGTFMTGVKVLPAGTWCRVKYPWDGILPEPRRYWSVAGIKARDLSLGEATDRVRAEILRSVELHLRSDVPVGIALSGGLDSSTIACAVRHVFPSREIHTFSYLADEAQVSEERWIDIVAKHIGATRHNVTITSADLCGDLDKLIELQEEPFGSTNIYAQNQVYRAAHEAGIKVMLDGQGADELLGGYEPYRGDRFATLLQEGRMVAAAGFLANHLKRRRSLRSLLFSGNSLLPVSWIPTARKLAGVDDSPAWANLAWFEAAGVSSRSLLRRPLCEGNLRNALANAVSCFSLPHLLRYQDRNSMAWSVESRVPFLTRRLGELLLALPEEYLISNQGETKHIMRLAMRGIVPDAVLDRSDKIGFQTPELTWLRQRPDLIRQAVDHLDRIPCLNKAEVAKACENMLGGQVAFSWQTWRLVNFALWHKMVA